MSYDSRVEGRIEINPPLNWAEARATGFVKHLWGSGQTRDVHLQFEEETTETAGGTSYIRRAVAIVPTWEDPAKYYELEATLDELVGHNAFATRVFAGALVRKGEDHGDVERYRVGADGFVITEKATLRWPDGTDVGL